MIASAPAAPVPVPLHDAWVVRTDDPADGETNMARDVDLLDRAVQSGRCHLRTYAFDPPTVSVGRGEDPLAVVDQALCVARGVGIVRRPTGGRAVLHHHEVTYCVAIPHGPPPVEAIGAFLGEWLAAALRALGVDADVVRSSTSPARTHAAYRSCFASASRWEVIARGRKIVGSAQRRWPSGTLQHGSILLGPQFRALGDLVRDRMRADDLARATCVEEEIGRSVTRDEVERALHAALRARSVN